MLRPKIYTCRRCKGHDFYLVNNKVRRCKFCAKSASRQRYQAQQMATRQLFLSDPANQDSALGGFGSITVRTYNKLLEKQCQMCAICTRDFSFMLHPIIDYDPMSGTVRGLLCSACKRLLRDGRENSGIYTNVIEYIRQYSRGRP